MSSRAQVEEPSIKAMKVEGLRFLEKGVAEHAAAEGGAAYQCLVSVDLETFGARLSLHNPGKASETQSYTIKNLGSGKRHLGFRASAES